MVTKSTRPSDRRAGKTAPKQSSKKPQRRREEGVDEQSENDDQDSSTSQEDQKHQQVLLNIFRDSFADVLQSESFTTVLQAIKQALYERDFERAFADPRNLDVYSTRWSPTRALCYSRVFGEIRDELDQMLQNTPPSTENILDAPVLTTQDIISEGVGQDLAAKEQTELTSGQDDDDNTESSQHITQPPLRALAIGGGAAEAVAFASHLSRHYSSSRPGHITLLDIGPWDFVVSKLHQQCTTPPTLSKYANAAAKAANSPLLHPPSRLSSTFVQRDILKVGSSSEELRTVLSLGGNGECKSPLLITMLFTLNELYTTSGIGKTTKFLRTLTSVVVPGTLLLVVDSPGSYSEASVGKEGAKKKYPMQWLLDHTLRGQEERERIQKAKLKRAAEEEKEKSGPGQSAESRKKTEERQDTEASGVGENVDEGEGGKGVSWEKLDAYSQDSVWFRMPEALRYPISLENMRYQMHLYKAI